MKSVAIEQFMTRNPRTIGGNQSLAEAHRIMRDHGIRHLPVLDGEKLVGIVSQRDLHLLETFADIDQEEVPVADAMSADVEVVEPTRPLAQVAAEMADRRIGSVVVMEGSNVIGIFTTVDALRALARLGAQ